MEFLGETPWRKEVKRKLTAILLPTCQLQAVLWASTSRGRLRPKGTPKRNLSTRNSWASWAHCQRQATECWLSSPGGRSRPVARWGTAFNDPRNAGIAGLEMSLYWDKSGRSRSRRGNFRWWVNVVEADGTFRTGSCLIGAGSWGHRRQADSRLPGPWNKYWRPSLDRAGL